MLLLLLKRLSSSWSYASHSCGKLGRPQVGTEVRLSGWIQYSRLDDKFLVLRDWQGTVQLVVPSDDRGQKLRGIPLESAVCVRGTVASRPRGQENSKMTSGDVEVHVEAVDHVSKAKLGLPMYVKEHALAKEPTRLKYRYLDLRRPQLQSNLRTRSELMANLRSVLYREGFLEVETPALFRKTPGGAREFVVPTKNKGSYFSLTQSPQQFKQLLMVGGVQKYFQVAKCYRDETARPDRQPEFTQFDLEMSFTSSQKIMHLVQHLLKDYFKSPFPTITYKEAMCKYGTDKPDLRLPNQICDWTSEVKQEEMQKVFKKDAAIFSLKCLKFNVGQLKSEAEFRHKRDCKKVIEAVKQDQQPLFSIISSFEVHQGGRLKGSLVEKLACINTNLEEGDFGFLVASIDPEVGLKMCGKLRSEMASRFVALNEDEFRPLWVVDFPLFEVDQEDGHLESTHHPFTAPMECDLDLLYEKKYTEVRGQHYDLVVNGHEVGGGSMRVHDPVLQRHILEDILHEDTDNLKHLLEALECGCPPHGGIALGLDRLVAILCNAQSIRDVIAFPKSSDAKDLMAGAPSSISQQDKDYYHLN